MILKRLSEWIERKIDASLDWLQSWPVGAVNQSADERHQFQGDLFPLDFKDRKDLVLELTATFKHLDYLLSEYGTADLRLKLQSHINRALAALDDDEG